MSTYARLSSGLLLAVALVTFGTPAHARTTTADVAKKKGLTIEKTIHADVDGDGTNDTVGVCSGQQGLQLCIFSVDKDEAQLKHVLPRAGGKKLGRVWAEDLVPEVAGTEIILEVYDETPDEKVKRVRVYSGYPAPREIFTSVIFLPKNKTERAAWDQADVVQYGDARPGWYFIDLGENGKKEILVRRQPKVINVKRDGEGDARLLVGVYESVFEYTGSPSDGEFREQPSPRFNEFLQPRDVTEVRTSSTWVRPDVLRELKSEALAAAVYADEGDKKAAKEPEIDFRPFNEKAADKSLDTGWVADTKGGKGEWVELVLSEPGPVRMVRVVPGCLETKSQFFSHNVPDKIEIRLDDRERAYVDLRTPKKSSPPVLAVQPVKIGSKPWAQQYLIFLDGKVRAKSVRVTIDRYKKQGRANLSCISEVTVH